MIKEKVHFRFQSRSGVQNSGIYDILSGEFYFDSNRSNFSIENYESRKFNSENFNLKTGQSNLRKFKLKTIRRLKERFNV